MPKNPPTMGPSKRGLDAAAETAMRKAGAAKAVRITPFMLNRMTESEAHASTRTRKRLLNSQPYTAE